MTSRQGGRIPILEMADGFRHAIITGAGRGLGRALAEHLAGQGTRITAVARTERDLHAVATAITRRGGRALAVPSDVGHHDAAHAIAARAVDAHGPVDLLVHAASTLGPVPLRPLVDTSPAQIAEALAVNVAGPFRLTRAVLPSMLLAGHGTVVTISSDAAVEAYPTWGAYGASKAALDHLTRIWAAELEGTGVRMVAIDPGEMNTRMHADAVPDADPSTLADPADVATWIVAALAAPAAQSRWVAAPVQAEASA